MAPPTPATDHRPALLAIIDAGAPNRFASYLVEILAAEGFAERDVFDRAAERVTPAHLAGRSVVLVANVPLAPEERAALLAYLAAGGGVVWLRPDRETAAALGLEPRQATAAAAVPATLADAYLSFVRSHPLCFDSLPPRLQFHGAGDLYRYRSGVSADAPLAYFALGLAGEVDTNCPAIINGHFRRGRYAVFAYDLAASTVLFRQGRPEQASTGPRPDADGDGFFTPNDLFVGQLDPGLRLVPQADLQQRVLARLLEWCAAPRRPLPRLWYFPQAARAIALINGDSDGMRGEELARFVDLVEGYGGRYSAYLMTSHYEEVPPEVERQYRARGHSLSIHPWLTRDPEPAAFAARLREEWGLFRERYSYQPLSVRHHCVVWPGWTETARALASLGFRLDLNFRAAYFVRDGYVNGSGLPMRFVDEDGAPIDLFQQSTLISDDFALQDKSFLPPLDLEGVTALSRRLVDESLAGYHTAVQIYFHPIYGRQPPVNNTYTVPWLEATLRHCRNRGVPMPSTDAWAEFVVARHAARLTAVRWMPAEARLDCLLESPQACRGLTLLVPAAWRDAALAQVTARGRPLPFQRQPLCGQAYALASLDAAAGERVPLSFQYRRDGHGEAG